MVHQTEWEWNIPGTEPEQHHGVTLVGVRNQQDRKHEEEKDVTKDKVCGEEAQLGDLAEELTTRLRDRVPSHGVPLSCPPGNVGSVSLELTSESKSDDKLEHESLDSDNSDHTRQSSGEAEALEEHEHNEEDKEDKDSDSVSNSGQDSSKLLAAHAEQGTRTTSQSKHASQDTCIDSDRTEGNDCDTDERTRLLGVTSGGLVFFVTVVVDTGLGVDEQEGDESDCDQNERSKDLTHEDVGEVSTRDIA